MLHNNSDEQWKFVNDDFKEIDECNARIVENSGMQLQRQREALPQRNVRHM